jgi:hypothetical protein
MNQLKKITGERNVIVVVIYSTIGRSILVQAQRVVDVVRGLERMMINLMMRIVYR